MSGWGSAAFPNVWVPPSTSVLGIAMVFVLFAAVVTGAIGRRNGLLSLASGAIVTVNVRDVLLPAGSRAVTVIVAVPDVTLLGTASDSTPFCRSAMTVT